MGEPLITVGLPVYNGAGLLGAAIDSILAQDLQDFEIVISDNASTDGTPELCEAYARADGRIRVFRQARNLGAPANWNFVARQARGTYFKWASASDLCAPRLLGACVERLSAEPDAVLAYPRTIYIDNDGQPIGSSKRDLEILESCPVARFKRVSAGLSINNAQQGLIRRSALIATRLDRPYPGGDLVLMAELALLGKFVLVPEQLLLRRASPEHWTANRSTSDLDRMFWPAGAPRLRMVHVRRHLDYLRTALTAKMPLRARIEAARFALKHAYWSRGVIGADFGQVFERGSAGGPR
jgi:hypothetical protein